MACMNFLRCCFSPQVHLEPHERHASVASRLSADTIIDELGDASKKGILFFLINTMHLLSFPHSVH
jgi:hypothetical protein